MKTNLHNKLEKDPESPNLHQADHFGTYCCCSDPLELRFELLGLDPWKIKGQMLCSSCFSYLVLFLRDPGQINRNTTKR